MYLNIWNWVGTYWSDSEKKAIAELLFSNDMQGNQPKGIALSGWRFNLGAGTKEQGDESGIEDKSRRSESFLTSSESYDWEKERGQQYFLQQAKKYGVNEFLMFSLTPQVEYTKNGLGYSPGGVNFNIKAEKYDNYVEYVANVINYFQGKGIDFKYYSPINEPQYNWDTPNQEGSPATNEDIAILVRKLDAKFSSSSIQTKMVVGEAANWNYLSTTNGSVERGNQIETFFSSGSDNYIGDLPSVLPAMSAHSYWLDITADEMQDTRSIAATRAEQFNLELWQTEYSLLSDGYEDYPGHNNASYIDVALQISKVIYHDLVYANVTSWSFWTAIDQERWGHKCRFNLITVVPEGGAHGDIQNSGKHYANKSLWALGNYSKFIRPGAKRIDLNHDGGSKVYGTAFLNSDNSVSAVYTNMGNNKIGISSQLQSGMQAVAYYTTSADLNLELTELLEGEKPSLYPRSITTVIYK